VNGDLSLVTNNQLPITNIDQWGNGKGKADNQRRLSAFFIALSTGKYLLWLGAMSF
jgi:hypothetical protein